jgi:serine/threonine-protein kinase
MSGKTQEPLDDMLLGRIAVEKGLISLDQLKEALGELERQRAGGEAPPLAVVLAKRGWLQAESFRRLSEEQNLQTQEIPDLPRYEIQGRLGEGATSVVYRAWDRELKRPVAIKVLRSTAALSEIARQRFRREAETAAGFTHPHLVQVHDTGEFQGQLYIIMELVEGRPLSDILKERKAPETDLVGMLEKAARGLGAAHEKGIVHRDLKPANILVTKEGEPKVGDFGLAHLAESKTELTRTGTTLGTPLYMSPEQVEGRPKDISARTDVYALGGILYEILTAQTPHRGETLAEIYGKIIREEPIPPRTLRPTVSRDLETIAQKALEKVPQNRYPSARKFAEDLRRAREGEPIEARPISGAERLWRKAKKVRALLLPVAGAILLGVLVGALVTHRGTAGSSSPERREAAVQAIRKARDFAQAHPSDVDGLVSLWQEAVFASDGTPYMADSKRELEAVKVRQGDLVAKELAELDQQTTGFVGREEYKAAQDVLESARTRHAAPEWALEVSKRAGAVAGTAAKNLAKVREQAATAKRQGDEVRAAELRVEVTLWGLPKSVSDFDQGLAAVPLPRPVADPALVGYWPLDEGSGQTARDASGKGHTASLVGTHWVAGKFGSGLRFAGTDSVMELPNSADLDRLQEGDYTLAAWYKSESTPATGAEAHALIVKPGRHLGVCLGAEGRFYMGHWIAENGGTYFHNVTFSRVEPGVFHHVAAVVDWTRGATRVYVDGVPEGNGSWPRPKLPAFSYGSSRWRVGCASPGMEQGGFAAKGVIDEVRLYNRALSDPEVQVLFHARLAPK